MNKEDLIIGTKLYWHNNRMVIVVQISEKEKRVEIAPADTKANPFWVNPSELTEV